MLIFMTLQLQTASIRGDQQTNRKINKQTNKQTNTHFDSFSFVLFKLMNANVEQAVKDLLRVNVRNPATVNRNTKLSINMEIKQQEDFFLGKDD